MNKLSTFFLILSLLFISGLALAKDDPSDQCNFILGKLNDLNLFETARKYYLSHAANLEGFLSVRPLFDDQAKEGGLIVYLRKGTVLQNLPRTFYGLPVNYKESDPGSLPEIARQVKKEEEELAKERVEPQVRPSSVEEAFELSETILEALIANQITINAIDIQDGLGEKKKGLGLIMHFPDVAYIEANYDEIFRLLGHYKKLVPLILFADKEKVYDDL